MSNLDIWYEDSNSNTLCFAHAVKAAMKGEHIRTEVQDNSDAGMSGAWWVGGCIKCIEESEKQIN